MKPRNVARQAFAAAVIGLAAAPALADQALAQQKNCLACHAIDKTMLGPSYQDVAARYKGRADAVQQLTRKLLQGGAGVWGTVPMPANAVTEAQAKQLAEWVLSQTPSANPAAARLASALPPPSSAAAPRRVVTTLPREQALRQGRYLVDHVMGCANCHAARAPDTSVLPGKELAGGRVYDTPLFKGAPGNLTSDRDTGIGHWQVNDIVRAITEGVRPNGLPLAPMMPVNFYKALTPEDAQAIATYLLDVPPVANRIEPPVYRQAWKTDAYADAERGFGAVAMSQDKLLRGGYLAALAHCLDCHTPAGADGATNYERDGGRGGRRFGVARVLAPNISSHATQGVGGWTDDELRRALFKGLARDGRQLNYPMPWPYLAGLTPEDQDSLVRWVRSLPSRD